MLPILVHSVHSFCDDTTMSHSLVLRLVRIMLTGRSICMPHKTDDDTLDNLLSLDNII